MLYKENLYTEKGSDPDKTEKVPNRYMKKGIKKNFLDITALIRSIQRAEGNPDCFRKGHKSCNQLDCAWRSYCLKKGQDP